MLPFPQNLLQENSQATFRHFAMCCYSLTAFYLGFLERKQLCTWTYKQNLLSDGNLAKIHGSWCQSVQGYSIRMRVSNVLHLLKITDRLMLCLFVCFSTSNRLHEYLLELNSPCQSLSYLAVNKKVLRQKLDYLAFINHSYCSNTSSSN